MLGASQFVTGGLVAPLVGALDNGTPVPMAAIMVAALALAGTLLLVSRRSLRAVG
jgi:DHA1 family bicyclomycin/chloramphenicol resistance-like MFS transporter